MTELDVKGGMVKDALGNKIIIGEKYGHTSRISGNVEVVIGEAIKAEDDKILLGNIKRGRGIYSGEIFSLKKIKRKMVSLIPNSVFPIKNEESWDV